MNGGKGGLTRLDLAALILAGVGCLLLHLGRQMWRSGDAR